MNGANAGNGPAGRCLALTPPGGAAIAVVRISGPGVGEFLARHFSRPVAPGRCVHGVLAEGERVVDDLVVVVSGDGTIADLSLHGGPWVVRSVLELARLGRFEVVDSAAAVLHEGAVDGDDVLAREVARHLPLASTELAVRTLLAQPALWERFAASSPSDEEIAAVLGDRSLYWLLHPPRIAIIGVPNAGKSTLANRLFARERSIAADQAGTTRDWVGEIANLDGLAVTLVDTPGLRTAADPIEREAIDRSREVIRSAHQVVLVLDPTQPREPDQSDLLRGFAGSLHVLNKCDAPPVWKTNETPAEVIRVSALTGEGVDALRDAIRLRFIGSLWRNPAQPRVWTLRQRQLLARALTDRTALSQVNGDVTS